MMGWHLVKELLMEYSLRTAETPRFRGCGESRQSIAKTWRVRLHVGGSAGGDRGVEHYGLAAAQFAITAIRTSYAQQQRSTAVSLGDDGMERMRAQIANVDANQYLDELIKGMGKRPSPPRRRIFPTLAPSRRNWRI